MSLRLRLSRGTWLTWPVNAKASDNFPTHSAIMSLASLVVWVSGCWLSCISWSMHCVMATAALEIIIVRWVLLTWDEHWGHSAKSASGRLQLKTHTPYVCGFAWIDMEHGCMVCTELRQDGSSFMWHQPCQRLSTPLRWIFKKRAIKS